jgi:hypothetical protein
MKHPAQYLCVVATILLSSQIAYAQSADSSGAPLFTIPNFQGDARSGDLYVYMHPTQHEQWDTYQQRLRNAAARAASLQPVRLSPSPEDGGSGAATFISTINAAAGAAGQNSQQQNSAMSASQGEFSAQQPQVTTNVSGAVLGAGAVPGLVEP